MYGVYLTVAHDIILCPKYEWDGKKTQQIFIYQQYNNISKLGCVIQQSQATHMLHEYMTSMTAWLLTSYTTLTYVYHCINVQTCMIPWSEHCMLAESGRLTD